MRSPKRAATRAQLPDNWEPGLPGNLYALERGLDVEAELEAFSDYHRMHGNLMADWAAAWRTWCRNSLRFGGAAASEKQRSVPTDFEGIEAFVRRLPDTQSGKMANGQTVPCINGYDVAGAIVDAWRAAGLSRDWRGDLGPIVEWLREGIDPETIIEAIHFSAKPRTLNAWTYYTGRVYERAGRKGLICQST